MSAQLCWIFVAVAAAAQAGPAAGVDLDPQEYGLNTVQNRTELDFNDRKAYFRILEHLQHVDPQALSRAAEEFRHQRWMTTNMRGFTEDEFPVFVDLFNHPQDYRGKPVTLKGHLVGPVVSIPADSESGPGPLYQAYLFDNDSQTNPATVIFTDLPAGIDRNAEIIDGVTATGYFLKIYWYRSRDGKRQLAPLLLARTIEHHPPPQPPEWPIPLSWLIGLVVAAAVLTLWIVLKTSRKDRGALDEYRRRYEPNPQFDASEMAPGED